MQCPELGRNGVISGCHGRALGYLAVTIEPALETALADRRQRAIGLCLRVGTRIHDLTVYYKLHDILVVGRFRRGGSSRADGKCLVHQRIGAGAVGAGKGKRIFALRQLADGQCAVQLPQVEPFGAAGVAGAAGGDSAAGVGNDGLDGADALRAGDNASDGEGGIALRQIVDDLGSEIIRLRHLGIKQPDGTPAVLSCHRRDSHQRSGLGVCAQSDLIRGDGGGRGCRSFFIRDLLVHKLTGHNENDLIQRLAGKGLDQLQIFLLEFFHLGSLIVCYVLLVLGKLGLQLIHPPLDILHFCKIGLYLGLFLAFKMLCDQRFDFFSEHGHKECRRLLIKRIFIVAVQGGNQLLYTLVASCRFLLRWFRGYRRIGYFRGADSDGQIQLCPHIIEHIAVTAAGQRPELACIGRGVLQHQRTVDNGQTLTILSREGIPAGVVISQRQRGCLGAVHKIALVHGVAKLLVGEIQDLILPLQRGGGILVAHHQCVRRLVDVQAAVHRGLHIVARLAEIRHGSSLYAVAVGQLGGHVAVLVVQFAALGVDGGDQLRLALVGKSAQPPINGAGHYVISSVHTVMDTAAPQNVLEGDGVVVQVEGAVGALQPLDQLFIADAAPVLRLGVAELLTVGAMTDLRPCSLEVGAVTCLAATAEIRTVGLIQPLAEVPVKGGRVAPQPAAEIVHCADLAGEHVQAEGGAAGIVGHRGNGAGVGILSCLIILTQRPQSGILPVAVRRQKHRCHAACQHHRGEYQRHTPFRPFHKHTPCLIYELYGKPGGGSSPRRFT